MSHSQITRRSVMAGAAAVPVAAVATVPAGPASAESETPAQRVDRLSRELSAALNDYMDGYWVAEIWPSDVERFPIRMIVRRVLTARPDAELVALGNEYDRLAAIEDRLDNRCWMLWRDGWDQVDHPFDPPRSEADYEKWKVARRKFEEESGFNDACRELEAHDDIMDPIGKKIEAMAPTTLAGVIAKAKFVRMWLPAGCYRDKDGTPIADVADVDDYGNEVVRQFIEELIALGGPVRSRAVGALS